MLAALVSVWRVLCPAPTRAGSQAPLTPAPRDLMLFSDLQRYLHTCGIHTEIQVKINPFKKNQIITGEMDHPFRAHTAPAEG